MASTGQRLPMPVLLMKTMHQDGGLRTDRHLAECSPNTCRLPPVPGPARLLQMMQKELIVSLHLIVSYQFTCLQTFSVCYTECNVLVEGGKVMTESRGTWVTMTEAARALHVSVSKLSRLAAKGKIETQKSVLDERVTLVNLEELEQLFASDMRRKGQNS